MTKRKRQPWNKGIHLCLNTGRTQFKKGMTPWNKGRTKCQKSSRKGLTLEEIYGVKKANEIKKKLRLSHLGQTSWLKGKKGIHCSPRTEWKSGKEHILWKGGISKMPYPFEFNRDLKDQIKKRDGYKCQLCGRKENLAVHHIDYNKTNLWRGNLITLCLGCNARVNTYRTVWKQICRKLLLIVTSRNLKNGGKDDRPTETNL